MRVAHTPRKTCESHVSTRFGACHNTHLQLAERRYRKAIRDVFHFIVNQVLYSSLIQNSLIPLV